MKAIKLFDYQQRMLEDIINVLTSASTSTFYNENGKKEKVGSSVMVQMPTGTENLCDGGCGEMVS